LNLWCGRGRGAAKRGKKVLPKLKGKGAPTPFLPSEKKKRQRTKFWRRKRPGRTLQSPKGRINPTTHCGFMQKVEEKGTLQKGCVLPNKGADNEDKRRGLVLEKKQKGE